jgi:hypothetical protein
METVMQIWVTEEPTSCATCNWYLYRGQKAFCRIFQNKVEYYCSERCSRNPEKVHHDQAVS